MSILNKIFWNEQKHKENVSDKCSIVGAGMVGMAVAVSMLGSGITKNLVLVDAFGEKVKGEVLDLQHGSLFLKHPKISGGNDFSDTAGSKLCIVTAGVRQEPGESQLSLAQRNADILSRLVPELVKHSPDTIILIVGHPCDVMTYVAWKSSGLPSHKVIGVGTTLDTQRFKFALGKKFNVNPANVHAWIIGQQGENSIALWSSVNIGGIRIQQLNPKFGTADDPENWAQLHKDVIGAAKDIEDLKGYTNWGVGMSVTSIARSLIQNKLMIYPVCVNAKGKFGIENDIFLPLPAAVGSNGVTDIVRLNLSEKELGDLKNTAKVLEQIQNSLKMKGKEVKCKCRRCK